MIELIYSLNTSLDDALVWLNDVELQYSAFLSEKRKKEFCIGRALVRHHLVTVHQVLATDVLVDLPLEKPPALTVCGVPYYVSISHSANAVVVTLSLSHKTGVDIEQLKPRKNLQALQQEFAVLRQSGSELTDFYRSWTQSEAYCKYSGKALSEVLINGLPADEVLFHSVPLAEHYLLSLCYSARQNPELRTIQSLLSGNELNSTQPLNLSG